MKKLISGFALLLITGCSGAVIEETKQRMPIPDERFYMRSETWYFGGKAGVGDLYDRDRNKKWDIVFNYLKCNGERQGIPYGVYDKFVRILTLDNDILKSINGNASDGLVDETIQNPGLRPVDLDAPDCP